MPKYFLNYKPFGASADITRKEYIKILFYLKNNLDKHPLRKVLQKYLLNHADKPNIKNFVSDLIEHLDQGKPFYLFAEKIKNIPAHWMGLLKTSETAGKLYDGLEIIVTNHGKTAQLKKQLSLVLIYPVMVLIAALTAVLLFSFYFLPMLAANLADLQVPVPPVLSTILWITSLVKNNFIILFFSGITIFIFGLLLLLFNKKTVLKFLTTVPPLSFGFIIWDRFQFFTNLKLSLANNQDMIPVLHNMRSIFVTEQVRKDISLIIINLHDGCQFSETMKNTVLCTPKIYNILKLFEDSEDLIAGISEIEEDLNSKAVTYYQVSQKLIEPVIFIFIGAVIFFIALMYLYPLNALIGNMKL